MYNFIYIFFFSCTQFFVIITILYNLSLTLLCKRHAQKYLDMALNKYNY